MAALAQAEVWQLLFTDGSDKKAEVNLTAAVSLPDEHAVLRTAATAADAGGTTERQKKKNHTQKDSSARFDLQIEIR